MTNQNSLEHFGILGMQWGKRKNTNGPITDRQRKREEKQVNKEVKRRNPRLFVKSNNYAADRINNGWIGEFNAKWEKKIGKIDDWAKSPLYDDYIKDYSSNLIKFMNDSLRNNPEASFKTTTGKKYVAKFLEDQGQMIIWATEDEWKKYEKSKKQ